MTALVIWAVVVIGPPSPFPVVADLYATQAACEKGAVAIRQQFSDPAYNVYCQPREVLGRI
jgi:hypothetical protein